MELLGRMALVTGAGARVGRAIAVGLAGAGCDVAVHFGTNGAGAEETAAAVRALGRQAWTAGADLSEMDGADTLLKVLAALGETDGAAPVDILVNAASPYRKTPLADLTHDDWRAYANVHAWAPLRLSQALGLAMKARGAGKIVNITDAGLGRPYKGFAPYLATKGALAELTLALAAELAPEVQVNAVAPGTVLPPPGATDAWLKGVTGRTPLGRVGSPDDVARAVVNLCRDGDFITGSTVRVDGGASWG